MRCIAVVLVVAFGCSKAREPSPGGLRVPGGTALVATISLEKLRASMYWPKLEGALAARLPLADLQKSCAIDPVRSIQSLTVTTPIDFSPAETLLFVRGVARDAAESCAKSFAASQNQTITVEEDGAFAVYRQDDEAMYATWLDAKTVVVAPGDLMAKERLAKVREPARHPAAFADALGHLRTDRVIAFAFYAPPRTPMAHFIGVSGLDPESGYGWIDLDTALRAEVVTRFANAERAAAAAKQTFVGPLAKLRSAVRDREVVFTLELDAEETAQVVEQLIATAP